MYDFYSKIITFFITGFQDINYFIDCIKKCNLCEYQVFSIINSFYYKYYI